MFSGVARILMILLLGTAFTIEGNVDAQSSAHDVGGQRARAGFWTRSLSMSHQRRVGREPTADRVTARPGG